MLHQPLPTSLQVSVTLPQQCSTKILQLRHSGQSQDGLGWKGPLKVISSSPELSNELCYNNELRPKQAPSQRTESSSTPVSLQMQCLAVVLLWFSRMGCWWLIVLKLFYILKYFTHLCSSEVWMLFFCYRVLVERLLACYFEIFMLLIFTKIPHPDCNCVHCSIYLFFFFLFNSFSCSGIRVPCSRKSCNMHLLLSANAWSKSRAWTESSCCSSAMCVHFLFYFLQN